MTKISDSRAFDVCRYVPRGLRRSGRSKNASVIAPVGVADDPARTAFIDSLLAKRKAQVNA